MAVKSQCYNTFAKTQGRIVVSKGKVVDIERMREFIEFAKSMNFTTAAKELHMSQPALSKHVQDLEAELRVSLVQRGGSSDKNRLTPTGVLFVDLATQLLSSYEELVEECRELDSRKPPVRIQGVQHGFTVVSQLRQLMESQGLPTGNFRHVKTDLSICDALNQDLIDFAVHLEPTDRMGVFSAPEMAEIYGWIPLKPEVICFLVGAGNPLFGAGQIDVATLADSEIIYASSPAYESWMSAVTGAFLVHGTFVRLKGLPDTPLEGGAFPVGPHRLAVCTERFARYYHDLDAEVTDVLYVRDYTPVMYPFLVYRRDNPSSAVQQLVECYERKASKE